MKKIKIFIKKLVIRYIITPKIEKIIVEKFIFSFNTLESRKILMKYIEKCFNKYFISVEIVDLTDEDENYVYFGIINKKDGYIYNLTIDEVKNDE
jgi:hypothetical protein